MALPFNAPLTLVVLLLLLLLLVVVVVMVVVVSVVVEFVELFWTKPKHYYFNYKI